MRGAIAFAATLAAIVEARTQTAIVRAQKAWRNADTSDDPAASKAGKRPFVSALIRFVL